jgi:arylformamidase
MPEGISRYVMAPVSEWKDITLLLGKDLPALPTGMSERPVQSPHFERFFDVDKGDRVTMSRIEMNSHDGTHIDAPLHFFYGGTTIDNMPLDTTVGPARVIEIQDTESIKPAELETYDIQPGERILFKTKNSPAAYATKVITGDYVYISTEAARFLVEKKVRLVGLDYLTIGNFKSPENIKDTHEILLGNGVYVIEGLNLSEVEAGEYELICLPLKLERGDAGPCRAILRPL